MLDAGLIDAEIKIYQSGSTRITVKGLTWAGHDFYESVSSDAVWRRTKDTISQAVGSASLSVIKATAEGVSTAMIRQMLP